MAKIEQRSQQPLFVKEGAWAKSIVLYAKRLLNGLQVGDYSTALKGSGFEFDQLRDYVAGDDVRFIDWKASARTEKLLVRQYVEERNRTVWLVLDTSASMRYGSGEMSKFDIALQVAGVLALVSSYGKDNVGLVICSKKMVCIPPGRGRMHVHRIMQELEQSREYSDGALVQGLEYLREVRRHRGLVFLISDFVDEVHEKTVRVVSRMHEVVAVRCLDQYERAFPAAGLMTMKESEGGQDFFIDARESSMMNAYLYRRVKDQDIAFRTYGFDCLDLTPGVPCVPAMILFFKRRMMY